jgi:hypothetical protein
MKRIIALTVVASLACAGPASASPRIPSRQCADALNVQHIFTTNGPTCGTARLVVASYFKPFKYAAARHIRSGGHTWRCNTWYSKRGSVMHVSCSLPIYTCTSSGRRVECPPIYEPSVGFDQLVSE